MGVKAHHVNNFQLDLKPSKSQQYKSPSDASAQAPKGYHIPKVALKSKYLLNYRIRPGLDRLPCFSASPLGHTTFSVGLFFL
jgi:hypothetical protein